MLKKAVLGTLLIGLIGILVAGAIIRTVDKTENVAEARGQGQGQSEREAGEALAQGQGGQGYGRSTQGTGNGQARATADRQYPNYDDAPEDMSTYEGTVILSPETGGDLVIVTDEGEEITVGTGPSYMQEAGFALQAGERVQVLGYWEDNELRAAQLTRLQDGQMLTLRDELGRPAWSGAGSRAIGQQNADVSAGRGGSGYNGAGNTEATGEGEGTGLAEVSEWLELSGTVTSVDASLMAVAMDNGVLVEMEGRPWTFAQEQGFTATAGNQVMLTGFYEDGEFEVGKLQNLTTEQPPIAIRGETGRPLWAGGGWRGS